MSTYRRALLINSGRQPFELVILGTCVLAGVSGLLVQSTRAPVIVTALGQWAWLWYAGLLIGGGIPLFGVWLSLPLALLIERAAMVWLSALFLAYGAGITFLASSHGITAAALVLGCGFAAAARVVQITQDLKKLQEALAAPTIADQPLLGEPNRRERTP